MIDIEAAILEELEVLSPAEEVPPSNWADIRARAGNERRPYQRVRIVVLVLAIVIAIAAPTLAFSARFRSMLGLQPLPKIGSAHLVLTAPIGNGLFAHYWHTPSTTGGECFFVTTDDRLKPASASTANARAGNCNSGSSRSLDRATARTPVASFLWIEPHHAGQNARLRIPPIVGGSLYPGLRAQQVAIRWHGGWLRVPFHGGYFLGGSLLLYKPPFDRFPFVLVALDAHGHVVAQHRLDSPSLRLMTHGWKQYGKAYHRWKAHHG